MIVSYVLVDNRSAVNICPLSTIKRMSIDQERIQRFNTVIQAFDRSRNETIRMIHLPVEIGQYEFQDTFQVLNILAAYSMFLGRPWIHPAGAVPLLYIKMSNTRLMGFWSSSTASENLPHLESHRSRISVRVKRLGQPHTRFSNWSLPPSLLKGSQRESLRTHRPI